MFEVPALANIADTNCGPLLFISLSSMPYLENMVFSALMTPLVVNFDMFSTSIKLV